jgi:large subunit ribosomal protein L29
MNADELRQMDDAALTEQLDELHRRWRELRFDEAVGKLTNTAEMRKIRRTIARIHTIQTERAMAAAIAAGQSWPPRRKERKPPVHRARRVRVGSGRQ